MSGFSADWLALREPADHRSVNAYVRQALVRFCQGREHLRIVDLGCGAGSNLRGLSPAFESPQHWTLVDYDPALLAAARARLDGYDPGAPLDIAYRQADLSGGAFAPVIQGADLVTAAALFDLVSAPVIAKLAAAVAAEGQAFYTVLTYDGIAAWLPEQAVDTAMRNAFNAHQQGDKGFGPAAGPAATDALAAAFTAHGYRIVRGKSPWVLDGTFATLRREVDRGWAAAAAETGQVPAAAIAEWLSHRLSDRAQTTIVGHEDLLALPPD
jgi:SAM-dependent methyltransferase